MCSAQSQRAAATRSGMIQPTSAAGTLSALGLTRCGKKLAVAYAVAPADALKTSPVLSMLCMMTASFRATATAARLKPNRSRSLSPQLLRLLSVLALALVRSTVAAS